MVLLSNGNAPWQFSLTQEVDDGVVRICPSGELDLATVPLLEAALEQAGVPRQEAMVLDLGNLTFIDVAGLRAVLAAKEERQGLALLDGSAPVRRLFELTSHDHFLDSHE